MTHKISWKNLPKKQIATSAKNSCFTCRINLFQLLLHTKAIDIPFHKTKGSIKVGGRQEGGGWVWGWSRGGEPKPFAGCCETLKCMAGEKARMID